MGYSYHSMILLKNGDLYGSGRNSSCQLGLGNTSDKNNFTKIINFSNIKQVSCGTSHSGVLLNDGTVYLCGSDAYYGTGFVDTGNRTTFTKNNNISNVKQIECGNCSTFAVLNDGSLYYVGYDMDYVFGKGDNNNVARFTKCPTLSNVKKVSNYYENTLVLLEDGTLYGAGRNSNGLLGLGTNTVTKTFTKVPNISNVKDVCVGYYNSIILLNDGTIMTSGSNSYGQLGLGDNVTRREFTKVPNISNVKQICAGEYCSFALLEDGTLYGCGANSARGMLGLESSVDKVNTFTKIPNIPKIRQISCSLYCTFVETINGELYVTGYNAYGEIGLGINTSTTIYDFTKVSNISDANLLFNVYKEKNKFLIKMDNKYYSFLESQYDEPTHMYNQVTFNQDAFNTYGEDIEKLIQEVTIGSDTFKPIEKFKNFKLIADKESVDVRIKGIRNSQMIATMSPINLVSFGNIKSINADYTLTNGEIKFAFSFDNGITWKTYDTSSNTWNNLSSKITLKNYTSYLEKDIVNWNNAKDEIITNGISIQDLQNVDFDVVNPKTLMFAIAFSKQDYTDTVTINKVNIEYFDKSCTKLAVGSDLSKYEAKVLVSGDTINVTTADDYDRILVTLTTSA